MAEIAPFRALRYNFEALGGDVTKRIAPPYDILDQADKERLLARSDRNIVAVDLPYVPAKALGPPEGYEQAAATLRRWIEDGTLVRESAPAVYAYHQVFEYAGRRYTRRCFIARLRLQPFSDSVVVPHEETFGGPKEDRLALMKATAVNLSSVFALFPDPEDQVGQALAPHLAGPPHAFGTLDGVESRVWIVTDSTAVDRVVRALADRKVYIADGHHRYGTALNYRDWAAAQSGGSLPPGHPANFVMITFGSMDDPGNLILPTHRVLPDLVGISLDRLVGIWAPGCQEVAAEQADLTLCTGPAGPEKYIRFTNRAVLPTLASDKSAPWCALDLAYLHRYLIDELLAAEMPGHTAPRVVYYKSADDARQYAAGQNGIALLCKACTMAQLRSVGEAGDLMPQKSTYFYPKVATGLTINLLQ